MSDILRRWPRLLILLIGLTLFSLVSCGGSGGGNSTTSSSDFSISVSPGTLVLAANGNLGVTVSATGVNGFSAVISISISGLPDGVSADPASFSLSPGGQQQVTVTAGPSVNPGTTSIMFHGTSGSLSHSAQAELAIVMPVSAAHPPIRTQYLRTNSFYAPNEAPPHLSVYDSAHKQFLVSNPFLNEIDVFDAANEVEIARIPVPLAWGLDISPYNGNLYAGTLIGDVYQIDTSTFGIINRYLSASIGPDGFSATTALVLSDGRLAMQGGIGSGAVLEVDGYGVSAVWDPATNSLDTGGNGSVCNVGNEGAFAVSGDRTRVLVTTIDSGGGGETVCSYDPVAKVATYGTFPFDTFVRQIIPTPDGARFFLTSSLNGVGVFDARTVNMLGQITGSNPGELPNAPSGGVISMDGKTLYLVDQLSGAVGAWDATALNQTGWVPSFTVVDSQSSIVVAAVDENGLIIGPMGHGVAFIDASQTTVSPPTMVGTGFAVPPTGPLTGDTTLTNFASGNVTDSATLNQIFVGNVPGSSATFDTSPGHENSAQVTTPPSTQTLAVDLAVVVSDGGVGIAPENFSYGPTILEVVPNGATAEGGQTGAIIGYGFGNSTSGIQVTIGGQSAPVTAIHDGAPIEPYPFPVDGVQFTIPPGASGTSVDVTLTTPSGTVTSKGAFHYTAALESYPLTASLQAGLYDAGRDLYYFADAAQIQVLSRSGGQWLSPITLPATSSATQLVAISESPDGSQLAVSDFGGQAIYVLNPDNPSSAKRYPMSLDHDGFADSLAPAGLAVTNAGIVYFDAADINGTGTPLFHKLNTTTHSMIDLGYDDGLSSNGASDRFNRVLLSPDGDTVYSSIAGDVTISFWLDTSNDHIHYSASDYVYVGQDLAVSGDGSTIDAAGKFSDSLLNSQIGVVYIDWETWLPLAVYGQKLNQDGSILFQPLTDGIDMIDRSTGRLLYRIQIPITPADVYDPLLVANGQRTLAVISSAGVSFVDLSSLSTSSQGRLLFEMTHSKAAPLPDRQRVKPINRNVPNHPTRRPKLRFRLIQTKKGN